MVEFNSSLVRVPRRKVIDICTKSIQYILNHRAEEKEKLILELMQPYKYFWKTKRRTRKEAEKEFIRLTNDYSCSGWRNPYRQSQEWRAWVENRFNNLLKAANLSIDCYIFLSIDDAVLVSNWEK